MPKIIVCDNKVKGPKRDRRSSASQQPKMCPPCVLPPADIVSIFDCRLVTNLQERFKLTVCHAAVRQAAK